MKTPTKVQSLDLIATCVDINQRQWDEYMENTVKANGLYIRKLIKKHLPELYDNLCLQFRNPFEHQSKKKNGLLIYVHSGVEYFLKFN